MAGSPLQEAMNAWKNAGVRIDRIDQTPQALAFRGNFRINLRQAFSAIAQSAFAILKGSSITEPMMADPLTLFEVAGELFSAITTAVHAVREQMHPAEFVGCLVLATAPPSGFSEDEFNASVDSFLATANPQRLPWYLGINERLIDQAKESMASPDGHQSLLKRLRDNDRISVTNGRLSFRDTKVVLGLS